MIMDKVYGVNFKFFILILIYIYVYMYIIFEILKGCQIKKMCRYFNLEIFL